MANKKKGAEAPKVEPGEARIEYVRLADVKVAKRNPKLHEIQAIVASIKRHGFVAPPIENAATGRIVAGHGRKEALEAIKAEGGEPPARIKVDADGEWMMPVVRGVAFPSETKAEEYLVGDNRLVELGGWDGKELGPIFMDIMKRGEEAALAVGYSMTEMQATIDALTALATPPGEFPDVNPGTVTVQYCCPKCAYKWSGSPDPAKKIGQAA